MIDPIQGYNISKNCDDASPRFFVGLDSIEGFCVFGANSEGPVGSPTAWKNKRPRPGAVLIPGYNICKICVDASLSYFRRIFWKSLFRHLPDSLDVWFGGSYPRPLRPAGTQWGHQTVDMTNTSDICENCDDASPKFSFETKLYIRLLIPLINDEGSTGPPTAGPNQAIVAFDRPYPGVQYIQKLRWRKS